LLQRSQEKMSEWKMARARIWQDFGSITLAQRMVRKRVRKASLYTPRGQEKRLG
jgi:hypothetical protein